jgi:hypothetical protein
MGWTDSPPFFCVFTETICDLTNAALRKNVRLPRHALEDIAGALDYADCKSSSGMPLTCEENSTDSRAPAPCPPSTSAVPRSHHSRLKTKPTAYVDVFVYNFCGEGQNSRMNPLKNQRRTRFHTIDKVFRPNDTNDNPHRKEPISVSKLEKGDAALHDEKCFLGWDFHGSTKELRMAQHRRDAVIDHIN